MHQLRVCFAYRNKGPVPADPENGIPYRRLAFEIRNAINEHFPRLVSDFGWPGWLSHRIREVCLRDLGPGRYGVAALEGREESYMVISPRAFDATPELSRLRRRATVVHELVHLMQFQSPLFLHFYKPLRYKSWDPNWWLHESSALATEICLVPEYPIAFQHLWKWVTQPQLSLDTDNEGHRALPLMLFLINELSIDLPATLYRYTTAQVPSMLGTEILAQELASRGTDLPTQFLRFCVAAAPAPSDVELPGWLKPIIDLVGRRSYCQRYRHYPVNERVGYPVQHLGCRYFRFAPPQEAKTLRLGVRKISHPEMLRGTLTVFPNDADVEAIPLERDGDDLVAVIPDFGQQRIKTAVLTLANCAYGKGWAAYDDLRFSLCANLG